MAEQQAKPLAVARMVTTTELARFETCRLAWWYDRTHPLAHASPAEIARRLELFEAVYGPGVRDLPEYHLLTHLRDQAPSSPPLAATKQADPPAAPAEQPHRLPGCIITTAVSVLLLLGIVLAMTRR